MIRLEEITFKYEDKIILDKYSLYLCSGKYRLVGENGTGKTTLFKVICGELRSCNGIVEVNGRAVKDIDNQELYNSLISYARQEDEFIDNLTVKENLEMFNVDFLDDKVDYLMRQFDVDLLVDKYVNELSGGERKKFQLIRTFASDAGIILLDEPDNHLDMEAINVLEELIDCTDKLIIVITHSNLLTNLQSITLSDSYIQPDVCEHSDDHTIKRIKKTLPKLKMAKSYHFLIYLWMVIALLLVSYYSFNIHYLNSIYEEGISLESFQNENSIYLKAPVNNSYSSLFGTDEWFQKIPAYFNQQFVDELSTSSGIERVVPMRNNDILDSCIYYDNDVYYQDVDENIYNLPASETIISNTNLYGVTISEIDGRLPRDDQDEIIISNEYAKANKLKIDDKVEIMTTNSKNQKRIFSYKVVGVYEPESLNANFISYNSEIERQHIFDLNNNIEYRANKLSEVEANSNQKNLIKVLEGQKLYEMLYVEFSSEEELQEITSKIFDYDPYIEVISSVNLESNYINRYKHEKIIGVVSTFMQIFILLLIILLIIVLLATYKFFDMYLLKLFFAGYLSDDVKRIHAGYSKSINHMLIGLIIIVVLTEWIFKVWSILWITVLCICVLKVLLLILNKRRKFNLAIKN